MIDVATTGLYDVCLFNSAAGGPLWSGQVMRVPPTACVLSSLDFPLGICLLRVLSKGAMKRQLEFYYGSLIRLSLHNVPVCLW